MKRILKVKILQIIEKFFPGGASSKESTCQCRRWEMWVWSLGGEDLLEEEMEEETHSSILA